MYQPLITTRIDSSWQEFFFPALKTIDPSYIENLERHDNWLPGHQTIFNAFSLPLTGVRYILFGESPYPRKASANGYAFWDAAVDGLWSETGLAKQVNRATSLRNFIKMLLVADGHLTAADTSQETIARLDKADLVQNNDELFSNLIHHGFLLLNASLVLTEDTPRKDARAWEPFIAKLLALLAESQRDIQLILLGKIAQRIQALPASNNFTQLIAEHPYNISFISNPEVLAFFGPLHLLKPMKKLHYVVAGS